MAAARARATADAAASSWSGPADADAAAPPRTSWDAEFVAFERQRLLDALDEAHGNKSEAARLLGMPRSTFCSKLKKHGLIDKGARARGQSG